MKVGKVLTPGFLTWNSFLFVEVNLIVVVDVVEDVVASVVVVVVVVSFVVVAVVLVVLLVLGTVGGIGLVSEAKTKRN